MEAHREAAAGAPDDSRERSVRVVRLRHWLRSEHILWRALLAVQLTALLVTGGTAALRHHVWAEVDERAHYDFIQKVVEEGRLPRPTDLASPETQAIADRTYPRASPNDPADQGLGGRSYEAIQPPLYYLTAAPAFAAVPDHRDKVTSVRLFNLALLLCSAWLLWRLARELAPAAALPAVAVAMTVMLWPGLVVRVVTISNIALEIPLTLAFLLVLWRADQRGTWRAYAGAAVLLGLCLLTKVSLQYLAPLLVVVLGRRFWREPTWHTAGRALAIAVIPILLVAPWIGFNLARYGAPMVDILGAPQLFSLKQTEIPPSVAGQPPLPEAPAPEPADRLSALPNLNVELHRTGVLPQGWDWHLAVPWIRLIAVGVLVAIVVSTAVLLVAGRFRGRFGFLAFPALCGLFVMNAVYVLTGDNAFQLRYLYPALLPLGLGVGAGVYAAVAPRRWVAGMTAVVTVSLGAVWFYMAGSHYFKDVGGALGIPSGF